ncbi:hypothetical protein [Aquabacterium sp.]|uniref:hypothetical protein n=1 Tax=Aquabacterium sp. TaxID=1872578 RepID=UPI002488CB30|nr:hypothetical protein [Aquabacterium sp.]MDI1261576.1 hypothetical protein [Aquabacterium sp.]
MLLILVLQTAPIWFAAKIVGAGKTDFLPVGIAVVAGGVISGLLLAFILFVLGLSFQAALNKFLGVFSL